MPFHLPPVCRPLAPQAYCFTEFAFRFDGPIKARPHFPPGPRVGACPLPADQKDFIWITHFGLRRYSKINPAAAASDACYDPSHGVVAMPFVPEGDTTE